MMRQTWIDPDDDDLWLLQPDELGVVSENGK
jgi:hypothetical protein